MKEVFHWNFGFFSAKAFLKSGFLYLLSLPGGLESHSLHDALWTRSNTEAFAGTD